MAERFMRNKLPLDELKMDKTAFSVSTIDAESDEIQFWLSKTPAERLLGVEIMRQMLYGYDPSTARLQRIFETAELL